jgi:hypothetical protein
MPASSTTLKQVRDEIVKATGRDDIDGTIDKNINASIIELIYKVKMREFHKTRTFNTSGSTEAYALQADEFAVVSVRNNTDNKPITPRKITQRDEIDTSIEKAPTHYTEWDEEILLFDGIPNGVYEIELKALKRPTALSADSDPLPTPEEWDEAIRMLSLAKTLANPLRQWEEVRAAKDEVTSIVAGRNTPAAETDEHTGDQFFQFSDFTRK